VKLPHLGPRQAFVLASLKPGEPVSAEQVGRLVHDRRWLEHCGQDGWGCDRTTHHPSSDACAYCAPEGIQVLLALHRRRLIRITEVTAELREGDE
jgi:hypothetical protein